MEVTEQEIPTEVQRATEIDTGAIPLSMENVILALPQKPTENRSLGSVMANPWSYEDLTSQAKLIGTFQVTPSTSTTEPIWTYRNTWLNVARTHFRTLNDLFIAKSWKLNFLLEFRSNFQQVGMFNIVHSNIPEALEDYLVDSSLYKSFAAQCQLPHRFVFMGEDIQVHLSTTWLSPFLASSVGRYSQIIPDQLNSEPKNNFDDYDMGAFFLYAPFPMQVATGVSNPQMTVRIYSFLSELTYAGYNPNDNIL